MRRNVWTRCWEVGRSEFLPLVVLTAVSLQLISPFLTQRFIGNSDAEWYYCLLSDYVHQTRAGVFPVYVGQSTANWNGHPTVLLPGYLLTGAAIDFVTGGSLAVTQVQHLTLAWSIWVASLSAYCCLRALPTRRWLAVALACLYVSCPGVLSLPARLDMYPSFISAPYIPLLFYGLIRSARRPDATAVALVGGGLALIWMSHAAIALWCTTLTALFLSGLAVFSGRFWQSIRFAVQSGALFAVLSAWYFGSIFSTGAHHSHNADKGVTASSGLLSATGPGYADMVMSTLAIPIPDIYLPLDADFGPLSGFQLGYTLLSVFLLAAITAIRTRILELRLLVALALGLLLVVHPIPWVTWHFWANLPRQFNITSPWPMQRFYIILAGIGVFAGAITAEWVLARRGARDF